MNSLAFSSLLLFVICGHAFASDRAISVAEACSDLALYVEYAGSAYGPGGTGENRLEVSVGLDDRARVFRIVAGSAATEVLNDPIVGLDQTVKSIRECFLTKCDSDTFEVAKQFSTKLLGACREDYLAEMEN